MQLTRALSISYMTALAAVTALSLGACGSCQPSEGAGAGKPEAAPVSSLTKGIAAGSGSAAAKRRDEDRFAAKIAENLARVPDPPIDFPADAGAGAGLDNDVFRDRVLGFIRRVAAGGERVTCDLPLTSASPFRTVVWVYQKGAQVGRGEGSDARLCVALKDAARQAVAATGGGPEGLAGARLAVELPERGYSFVELEGKGVELTHGLPAVRVLDKALVSQRIDEGKGYLLRVLDRERGGAHKYYDAVTDGFEPQLHTIYTASTALTLLRLHKISADERLLGHVRSAADFMLRMQSHDESDRTSGGFFYSLGLERERPERRMVAGTAAKAIFTLLELHAATKEPKYLEAANAAAGWLIAMQRPGGGVRSSLSQKDGDRWTAVKKESMLYTGQTLSALSRMYRATADARYLDAAARTASYLAGKVSAQGCYLGDEYRKPNPISSSWVVLSLLDFVKATGDAHFEQIVFRCANELMGRQSRKVEDVYRYGRWQRSLSSSGNGWLAEVTSELYLYCLEKGREGCDRFKEAAVAAMRLLMQYTYSPASSFAVRNPEAALGGVFWSAGDRYVRTDSVCHAMNAYLNMVGHLGEGALLTLPEPPLAARLHLAGEAAGSAGEAGPEDEERDEPGAPDPEESLRSSAEDPDEEAGQKGPRR
jgi:hypothetical protein